MQLALHDSNVSTYQWHHMTDKVMFHPILIIVTSQMSMVLLIKPLVSQWYV